MNFDSFSHGQILSKIWLCEYLEPYLPDNANIVILGSWYNVLGFMLKVRNPYKKFTITGVDINPDAIQVANKLCNTWIIEDGSVRNSIKNANDIEYSDYNVVINCSPEHMEDIKWFNKIPNDTLTCIQSSNVTDTKEPWLVTVPSPTLSSFLEKFALSDPYYTNILDIINGSWEYERYMTIGRK